MRPRIPKQRDIFAPLVEHDLSLELERVDALIHAHPEWESWVHADLTKHCHVDGKRGRKGMSAGQLLRTGFLLRRLNVSLWKFAPLLADSLCMREFVGLGPADRAPSRSTLQENLAKIRSETWGKLLQALARSSEAQEIETGEKVRVDATVTRTPVHLPSDSSLLWDSIRVLTRHMKRASTLFALDFDDQSKAAKKLHNRIFYARKADQRKPAYVALLEVSRSIEEEVGRVLDRLAKLEPSSLQDMAARDSFVGSLEHYRALFVRVIDQTTRRVVHGESVPAQEKVLSIFEPHTDLIVKNGGRTSEFGHKITLTVGTSGMVLDCVIERGNPTDATLAVRQLERQVKLFGRPPSTAAFDGGYASRENLERAKELGVERCAFSKGRGLTPEEMAGSRRTYGRLRNFRAGIEAYVSYLKRSFGLRLCTWKGWRGFQSYVWSAVFAANLTLLARARPCAT